MYCDAQPLVDRLPRRAAVVGAERARGRDGDVDPLGIGGVENDGVQSHAARARLPLGPVPWPRKPDKLVPVLAAVGRAKQRRIFYAGVDRVRIGERRLQMPHALELPRMLRAVVPLVRGQRLARLRRRVVHEPVRQSRRRAGSGNRLIGQSRLVPGLAAVVRALDQLPEPTARLRDVNPVGIHRRSLHVVDFPAGEKRPAHRPILALAVGTENERALARPYKHSHTAHLDLLPDADFPLVA